MYGHRKPDKIAIAAVVLGMLVILALIIYTCVQMRRRHVARMERIQRREARKAKRKTARRVQVQEVRSDEQEGDAGQVVV